MSKIWTLEELYEYEREDNKELERLVKEFKEAQAQNDVAEGEIIEPRPIPTDTPSPVPAYDRSMTDEEIDAMEKRIEFQTRCFQRLQAYNKENYDNQ